MKQFHIQQGKGGFCLKSLDKYGATEEVMICGTLSELVNQMTQRMKVRTIDTYSKLIQALALDIAMMEDEANEGEENQLLGGLPNGTTSN